PVPVIETQPAKHTSGRGSVEGITACGRVASDLDDLLAACLSDRTGVLSQHIVAMRDDGLHRVRIALGLLRRESWRGGSPSHPGQAQHFEQANVHPADVKFVRSEEHTSELPSLAY